MDTPSHSLLKDAIVSLATQPRTDQKLPSGALPKSCGAKQFEVDGSAEENDRLQRYIDDYTSILSHPRSTLKKFLSVGAYDAERNQVIVTEKKGAHWKNHGHTEAGQLVLCLEEAIFLMECGCLEVTRNGLPLSLQQMYHRLPAHMALEEYQVYSSLKRSGYTVFRKSISVPGLHCRHVLEVYQPQKAFKKTSPGDPASVVIVATSSRESFPTSRVLTDLQEQYPHSELHCAVVDVGTIAYYTLHPLTQTPPPPR